MRGQPAALADLLHDRPILGYPFGFVMFLLALFIRIELEELLPPGLPFITFLPMTLFVAYLAGPGPAIMSSICGGLMAWYLFVEPAHSFAISPQIALALLFYWGVVVVSVGIVHRLRTTAFKLEAERARSADLAEQRAFLFKELQHRVANNMAFLVAILSLQKAAIRDRPRDAADILDDAIRRIRLFSSVHRRLHEPDSAAAALDAHFAGLFDDLIEATGAKHVNCAIDIEQVQLPVETVMTLSLIAAELMANAIKHAFTGCPHGTITVALHKRTDGIEFTISDNGVGAATDCEVDRGLGGQIVTALCEQINAQRHSWVGSGTHVCIRFNEAD